MDVPEYSAFGTSEVGPEAMSQGTGTVYGVVLSRASGYARSARTDCTTAVA